MKDTFYLIMCIFICVGTIKMFTMTRVKQVYGDFKRVKVGWLLSHIYVDTNGNKQKDGKLCLAGLICQIFCDVVFVAAIAGLIIIYLKTDQFEYLLYYTGGMILLSLLREVILTPMESKSKRLHREAVRQKLKNLEEEKKRQEETEKLRDENKV